ncbi:MAG: response regulator transcription factor [Parafilimonas sp.]
MYSNNKVIRLIIIDDHPLVHEGLQHILQQHADIEVLASCITATEALTFLQEQFADLILLDINLPDINGIDLCKTIKKLYPHIKILALSNHNERLMITKILQNGASGYILKNASSKELIQAIKDVMDDKLVMNDEVQKILATSNRSLSETPHITRRETEILKCIAAGLTTAQTAEKLFISPLTVETHRRNLMQKFEVNNAPELVHVATENKLI